MGFLDPKVWIAVALAFAIGAGVGYWQGGRAGRAELRAYKAQVEAEVLRQEAENARVQREAELAADAAATEVRQAFERLDAAESRIRELLADPRLHVQLPAPTRRVWRASVRAASKPAPVAARVVAEAGAAEGSSSGRGEEDVVPLPGQPGDDSPVDLSVLLETAAENHRNHLRCVAQVDGLQKFYEAVRTAYNGQQP